MSSGSVRVARTGSVRSGPDRAADRGVVVVVVVGGIRRWPLMDGDGRTTRVGARDETEVRRTFLAELGCDVTEGDEVTATMDGVGGAVRSAKSIGDEGTEVSNRLVG